MAVRQGFGKVVTDGLVFAYDTGDTVNSYKGEPTTNLVGNPTFIGTNGTQTQGVTPNNWVFSGFTGANGFKFYDKDTSPIPLKFPNEQAVITTGPNSTSNRRIYFRRTDLQPNTTYSISCWMYFSRRWSNSWSKFQYDSGGAGISLASEYFGSFEDYATARGIGLDEWFKWEGTLTTESNTAQCYWGPVISRTHDVLVGMQRMQVEVKDHVTPFVKGSRSVSGSLLDLTNTSEVDVTNVNFDSNAQFIFEGSERANIDYTGTDLDGNPEFTTEAVIKRTANLSNAGFWGIGGDVSLKGINGYTHPSHTNKIGIDLWGTATFHTGQDYPLNKYVHVVWVKEDGAFNTTNIKIYINGVLYTGSDLTTVRGSSHTPNLNTSTSGKGLVVGRVGPQTNSYHANGEMPMFKVYTRALTEGEVKQNFAMYKKRFNI